MFTSDDFPLGSSFYWVRECSFNTKRGRLQIVVFTKMQVDEISEKGDLIHYYFKPNGEGVGCVYEQKKYLQPSKSMIIPGYLFEAMKNFSENKTHELSPTQEITKILKSTGNFEVDQMIHRCRYSFKEVNDKINPRKKVTA